MTDDDLQALLKSALPAPADDPPSRDRWTDIVTRVDDRPRCSLLDLGLAAAIATALLLFPEGIWVVAYYL